MPRTQRWTLGIIVLWAAVMLLGWPAHAVPPKASIEYQKPQVLITAELEKDLEWVENAFSARPGDHRQHLAKEVAAALQYEFPTYSFINKSHEGEIPRKTINVLLERSSTIDNINLTLCFGRLELINSEVGCPNSRSFVIDGVIRGRSETADVFDIFRKRVRAGFENKHEDFLERLNIPLAVIPPQAVGTRGRLKTGLEYRHSGADFGMDFMLVIQGNKFFLRTCNDTMIDGYASSSERDCYPSSSFPPKGRLVLEIRPVGRN